jgi:Holliday junction resolvase
MANPNGRKGAQFETDVMRWLREHEAVAERLTKAGAKDEGDLYVFLQGKTYILELKNRKKLDLPAFWDEAQVEAKNYAKARGLATTPSAFVVVKRRQHGIEKSWVIQNLEQWMRERYE